MKTQPELHLVHSLKFSCNHEGLEISKDHLPYCWIYLIFYFLALCQIFNMKTQELEVAMTLRADSVALQSRTERQRWAWCQYQSLPADSWEFLFSASKCALMEMVQYLGWSPHYFVYIIGTKESERCLTSTVKMIITQLQRLLLLFSSASELGVFRRGGVMGVCSRNMAERGNNWNCCIICPPHYVWKRLVFMNCDHIIRQKWNTQTSKRPIKIK